MNKTLAKYKEKYPELSDILTKTIFIPKSLYNKYQNDNKIIVYEEIEEQGKEKVNVKKAEISELFLIDILSSPYYYDCVNKLFNNEIEELKIGYEEDISSDNEDDNKILRFENLSKADIITYLDLLFKQTRINLPEKLFKKFKKLKNIVCYETLKKDMYGQFYTIKIDKEEYRISINDILLFMQMETSNLEKICNDDSYKMIANIKKEYFFYAAYNFFKINEILKNYYVSDNVKNNYKKLDSLEMIDFEAINKFYKYDDGVNKIKLNEELEKEILKNMPSNLNKIESATYIYIKMCKLLSYDEEFFFAHKEAEVLQKHSSLKHLEDITLTSNEVVCYEFNAIYAKLLKDLNISFCSNKSIEEFYGTNNHAMIDLRCGKYLVSADSLTSIFNGDIINVKLNLPITGFKCENKNEKTKQDFSLLVDKIYRIVNSEEQNKKYYMKDFDDSNVLDKLLVLIEKVNFKEYTGMDFIAYVLKLYKILFNDKERQNNIKISIITDYKNFIHGGVIFCINTKGFNIGEENIYYLFDSRRTVLTLNRIELQELFDNGIVDYYDSLRYDLPGIKKSLKK